MLVPFPHGYILAIQVSQTCRCTSTKLRLVQIWSLYQDRDSTAGLQVFKAVSYDCLAPYFGGRED